MNGTLWLADVRKRFSDSKDQCDRALAQVPFERWTHQLGPESNSIATIMLHMAGNMLSRWTDFLTTDGEKPDRDRDAEFENPEALSREQLLARWEAGWACLFSAIDPLTDADLDRTVTIRTKPLLVSAAITRQVQHYGVHTGQIVLLAKHLVGESWSTLSVARGASKAFNQAMAGGEGEHPHGR